MPWNLYLAIKQLFPSGRRGPSFFFLVAVLGVALGVMVLVIVQSVMGGFGNVYRDLLIDTNGHLRVETGALAYDYSEVEAVLRSDPDTIGVAPFASSIVMVRNLNREAYPMARGIDPQVEGQVIPFDRFLYEGRLSDLDEDSVLMSGKLARQLGVRVGSTVDFYTTLMLEKLKQDEVLLPRELTVAGLYQTGWNDFDSSTLVVSIETLRDMCGFGEAIQGLSVRLREGADEYACAARLNERLTPPWRALTWAEMYQSFLWVLQFEKTMMLFILLFIVLIASFAIAIAQYLMVVRKTREIGLIGALGGKPLPLAAAFCAQGFLIGASGSALGCLAAVTALHYRDSIIQLLTSVFGRKETLIQFYQFDRLPVHYTTSDFVIIVSAALVLATLAGLIPAWRAAHMRPAEALRSE